LILDENHSKDDSFFDVFVSTLIAALCNIYFSNTL